MQGAGCRAWGVGCMVWGVGHLVGRDKLIEQAVHVERAPLGSDQLATFNCFNVYHKSPDSGERQYESRSRKRRSGPALKAGGSWADAEPG